MLKPPAGRPGSGIKLTTKQLSAQIYLISFESGTGPAEIPEMRDHDRCNDVNQPWTV